MKIRLIKVADPKPNRHYMTVMDLASFNYYFLKKKYSRTQFKNLLGVSDKVYHNTYNYHYPDRATRVKFAGSRISESQKLRNSNSVNMGIPRKLLKVSELRQLLSDGRSIEAIGRALNVAPATVRNNIKYYGIDCEATYIASGVKYNNIQILKSLDAFFGTGIESLHVQKDRDVVEIMKQLRAMDLSTRELKKSIAKIRISTLMYAKRRGIDCTKYNTPGSSLNYELGIILESYGLPVEYEHQVGNKLFDILLVGTNILIEIDGELYHNSEDEVANDAFKTHLAVSHGFHLHRLYIEKDTIQERNQKVIKCLKDLRSKGLLPLGIEL